VPAACLKIREAQRSEAAIQQSLIDVNVVDQELVKGAAKVSQILVSIESFKQTDASQNFEAFGLGQPTRL
jgi:hypothetical protein